MNRCRRCNAPLLWAETEKGRPIPIDPEPHADGDIHLYPTGGKHRAVVIRESMRGFFRDEGDPLYRSHFATCPYAGEFRRGRAADASVSTTTLQKDESKG